MQSTTPLWRRSVLLGRCGGALLARLFMLVCCLAAKASGGGDNGATADSELPKGARYGVFMFPPPGMCFPDSAAVYAATALADGLFTQARVRREGIRLRLRINGLEMASVSWDAGSGLEADEGLAHHFSIPELPDGEYEAELVILLGGPDGGPVGLSAETWFQVDQAGQCLPDAVEAPHCGRQRPVTQPAEDPGECCTWQASVDVVGRHWGARGPRVRWPNHGHHTRAAQRALCAPLFAACSRVRAW